MKSYGSFCPIAKAAEILAERWTLLLLRDMLQGSRHFSDLRRGVPQMSQTLLCTRLQVLEEAGLVVRTHPPAGRPEYVPTQAAIELAPIIEAIGHWGQTWVRSRLARDDLDAGSLMWFMHRHFKLDCIPARRLVMQVSLTDAAKLNSWWFVLADAVDLCWDDPGYDVDITLSTTLLTLTKIFVGDLSLSQARALGLLEVDGPRRLTEGMAAWFPRSKFADDNPLSNEEAQIRPRRPPETGLAATQASSQASGHASKEQGDADTPWLRSMRDLRRGGRTEGVRGRGGDGVRRDSASNPAAHGPAG